MKALQEDGAGRRQEDTSLPFDAGEAKKITVDGETSGAGQDDTAI